jgi:hypothetical protein
MINIDPTKAGALIGKTARRISEIRGALLYDVSVHLLFSLQVLSNFFP